jgi:hypothetical protein
MQGAVWFAAHHKAKTGLARSVYYGSRGIAPPIHNRRKWEVRFLLHPLDPRERTHCTHWLRGWVRPKRCSGCYRKEKNQCLAPAMNRALCHPAHNLWTVLGMLCQLRSSASLNGDDLLWWMFVIKVTVSVSMVKDGYSRLLWIISTCLPNCTVSIMEG